MNIGTLTTGAGVVTTIDLQYLPAYITYVAATQLTGLKVNVEGDGVLVDLDAAGLNQISGIRRFGAVANSYLIPLADGFIPNKVVTLTFTNSAAQTPVISAFALQRGTAYFVSQRLKVLASSGKTLQNFTHLGFTSLAAGDELQIKFFDGHVQKFVSADLKAWYTLMSNEVDSDCVDNLKGLIDYVNYIPAADTIIYVLKTQRVGEIY